MSDSWIILIPQEPDFLPAALAQHEAVGYFSKLAPKASDIDMQTSPQNRFVHCGANFSRILCPVCGLEISKEWWRSRMEEEDVVGYTLNPVRLPCCGNERNLNNIIYEWAQGFARFSIQAKNPDIGKLTDDNLREFERILNCRLRAIYCHL